MRPTAPRRALRQANLRRHRPRMPILGPSEAAEEVRTSDLVLAVTGVAMLGGICLALAGNVLAF